MYRIRAGFQLYVAAALCSIFCITTCLGSSSFPSEVPRCHYGDTDCITRTSLNLISIYAKTGLPAAAFPVIEPFVLKRVDISDGRTGTLNLALTFKDLSVMGLSSAKIDRTVGFERDPAKSKFEMHGSFPKLTMRGKYIADGRILILPIKGDGDADIVLHNPKFSVKFKPSLHPKDGKNYMTVDKLKVLVEPEKMSIKLTNLFNGDAALGQNLNEFLNANWLEVWTELQPSVQVAIAEVMKNILVQLFKKFAYEDIFLED